ncbi:MAG: DUF1385 domain-containing protein, partial [Oscillospiraceae bacterium]
GLIAPAVALGKMTSIGGQALMEGIMMVGPFKTVAAFAGKDGTITTEEMSMTPLRMKYPILGKPFIRGIFNMIDTLRLGMKALERSADKATEGEEEPESKFDRWITEKLGDKITPVITGIGTVLGLALSVVLFLYLPILAFNGIKLLVGTSIEPVRSLVEGVFRIIIFIGYLCLVSLLPDIKRVFMYHGAEHKTIFCYEAELPLTVENVRKQRRFHPRCGTSFLVILIVLGMIIGFFIPFTNPVLRTLCKILCLPITVCFGYELIKLCGRHNNLLTRIISAPGLWVQRITTKEPDDKMIETAIRAMEEVIPLGGEDIIG